MLGIIRGLSHLSTVRCLVCGLVEPESTGSGEGSKRGSKVCFIVVELSFLKVPAATRSQELGGGGKVRGHRTRRDPTLLDPETGVSRVECQGG